MVYRAEHRAATVNDSLERLQDVEVSSIYVVICKPHQ